MIVKTVFTAALLSLGLLGTASAKDICAPHAKADWLSKEAISAKVKDMGYDARKIQEEDGCWEVKGYDKAGAKVEAYFDPVSGELVKAKQP